MDAFILFLLLAAVLTIVLRSRPDEFHITRSIRIEAPPQAIFPHVNELRKWENWSPWAKLDPNAASIYEGPPSGCGASMAWDGNSKVGAGKMTIVESKPDELVGFRLEFIRPFKATNAAEFTFRPESVGTTVVWSMSGTNNLIGKFIGLFINCDKMAGGQFEEGLANMRRIVEESAAK